MKRINISAYVWIDDKSDDISKIMDEFSNIVRKLTLKPEQPVVSVTYSNNEDDSDWTYINMGNDDGRIKLDMDIINKKKKKFVPIEEALEDVKPWGIENHK